MVEEFASFLQIMCDFSTPEPIPFPGIAVIVGGSLWLRFVYGIELAGEYISIFKILCVFFSILAPYTPKPLPYPGITVIVRSGGYLD